MYDIHSGEWSGPNCPCDEAGEWVSTCEAHPTEPTPPELHTLR